MRPSKRAFLKATSLIAVLTLPPAAALPVQHARVGHRLSVDKHDSGYNPYLAVDARVLLDGVDISNTFIVTADENEGMVLRYVTHADGRLMQSFDRRSVMTEILRGKVVIILGGGKRWA